MMNLNLETFDFNQTGLLFLLVGALSVIREKRVIPYLLVAVGALTHGWFTVLLLTGLLLIDRFHTRRSKWLLLLNSIGFAALVSAWVQGEVYQPIFLIYGLFAVSFHFRKGGLGVVLPLMMTHQFFPGTAPLEIVLSAAGVYLILEEVLRLAKAKNVDQVMSWVELPVILAVLFPFHAAVLSLIEIPEAIAALSGALVLSLIFASVLFGKKVAFESVAKKGYSRGAKFYKMLNRSFSERQAWIHGAKPPSSAADSDFTFFFWSAVSMLILWAGLIAVVQGRFG